MTKQECPDCQSRQVYYRSKTDDFKCMRCPNAFKKNTHLKSPKNTPQSHPAHPNGGKK